ncbi:hypothetical protein HK097_009581 [Rhizophlyctis rosea]|uniref:Uncharacterized protein n=1 Tax=Rhizophlyctis rosea TaxID=64517 RepID=A0AAD5SBP2_9FUNG|nr:hypothetical protein HK097_009581 [Rhizophlyctis rosea]
MITPQGAVILNYVFIVIGLGIQLCNIAYGIRHAIQRPTKFNLILLACALVYAVSFVPLLLTSALTVELNSTRKSESNAYLFTRLDTLVRTYTALFGSATLAYILLVQVRFRVVKSLMKYRDFYDWIFVSVTITIWLLTSFLFGVILHVAPTTQSIVLGAWSVYALAVDQTLSFIFIRQLYKTRKAVSATKDSQKEFYKVVLALCLLCFISWLGLTMVIVSNVFFKNDHIMRTLLFRAAYMISPFHFSGAMVFIYTVRSLVVPSSPAPTTPVAHSSSQWGADEKGQSWPGVGNAGAGAPGTYHIAHNQRKSSLRTGSAVSLIDKHGKNSPYGMAIDAKTDRPSYPTTGYPMTAATSYATTATPVTYERYTPTTYLMTPTSSNPINSYPKTPGHSPVAPKEERSPILYPRAAPADVPRMELDRGVSVIDLNGRY